MNKKQKMVLVIGCICFCVVTLYPEWISKEVYHRKNYENVSSEGRHFIFTPPEAINTLGYGEYMIEVSEFNFINTTRLYIEWIVIVIPTLILFFVFKSYKEN